MCVCVFVYHNGIAEKRGGRKETNGGSEYQKKMQHKKIFDKSWYKLLRNKKKGRKGSGRKQR